MLDEEILSEIDATLDQLIRNAEAISDIELKELNETEIEAFQKTQESLLQHFIHMDEHLASKQKGLDKRSASYQIQQKLLQFEKMQDSYCQTISKAQNRQTLLSKRKAKKLL